MTIITTPHAGMLINQLAEIAKAIKSLPTNDISSDRVYPNKLQQQALLTRAHEAALHAQWALEEYNNGLEREGYKTAPKLAPVVAQ